MPDFYWDDWDGAESEQVKRSALKYLDARGLELAASVLRNAELRIHDYRGPESNMPEGGATLFCSPSQLPEAEGVFSEVGDDIRKALDMAVSSLRAAGSFEGRSWGIGRVPALLQSAPAASEGPIAQAEPDLWKPGWFRLFLSHAAAGKDTATRLKYSLQRYLVEAFVAHEDIDPTKEWVDVIEQALRSCDAMAALLTPDFHQSNWTDQEVGFVRSRWVLVVPIRLGLDPYGFIGRHQGMQGYGLLPPLLAWTLCEILVSNPLTVEKMTGPLVEAFAEADSFADAKQKMDLLERVASLTPQHLENLTRAASENRQVEKSFGVPDRVRDLVRKHSPKQ